MASSSSAAGEPTALAVVVESSSGKKITLKSSDGELFGIDDVVALKSQTMKNMIDVDYAGGPIPLPNITASIRSRVIEWCKRRVEVEKAAAELKEWEAEYLNMQQGKSAQEIRTCSVGWLGIHPPGRWLGRIAGAEPGMSGVGVGGSARAGGVFEQCNVGQGYSNGVAASLSWVAHRTFDGLPLWIPIQGTTVLC